jgi:CheY-like chemotaxis protein
MMQENFANDTERVGDAGRRSASRVTRVLVIEDDASVGAAIQMILSRRNCETVLVSRAHAGIHAFQSSGFDVVIVDLFMPGMNGLDTIERIRRMSTVPIIAMSGFALRNSLDSDVDFLGMAASRGATACVRKPFARAQLMDAVDRALAAAPSIGESVQ